MLRRPTTAARLAAAAVISLVSLSACGGDDTDDAADGGAAGSGDATTVTLLDPAGDEVGTVELTDTDDGTVVDASVEGLDPGAFHGFHVHAIGECEPDSANPDDPAETGDFLSAGGHLAEEGQDHSDHLGDLPPLLADADGTATVEVTTDRFALADLADGAAVMVHADPDNLGNIPERYAEDGPDEDTLATGDAGDRIACGVVEVG